MKKKGYTREVLRGMVRHYEKGLSENVLIWVKENIGSRFNCPICSYRDLNCYREEFSEDCPAITEQRVCFNQQWFRIVVSRAHRDTDSLEENTDSLEENTDSGESEVRKLLTVRLNYWKDKMRELYPR